jgi:ADP-heptose:LPS heptosyltransferase
VCGDRKEQEAAKAFDALLDERVLNLVGKTSLLDVLYIINNAELLIANESSAPHFAVSLENPNIIVIYNGNSFGRFTPYPKEITDKYHAIYHPDIEKNLTRYEKISNQYGYFSQLDINDIKVENIIKIIKIILH